MEKWLAKLVVTRRSAVLLFMVLATCFFGWFIPRVHVVSNMADLLSTKHPYVKLDGEFRRLFGGANLSLVQVRVKNGDIFNTATLQKIRRITDQLVFFPGVDRSKVYSIAARKMKNVIVSSWGMEFPPLMWPEIPNTPEKMERLKRDIFSNERYYGTLVSFNAKSALISAEFFHDKVNYRELFKKLQALRAAEEDANTEINIAGDPVIYGFIDHYLKETALIFGAALLAMVLLLYVYTRSLRFSLIPVGSALISGVWGVGFTGLLGLTIDPLVMVVPLLISARALSHSVQFNERLAEELAVDHDIPQSVFRTVRALLYPGLAGIITDAIGILTIAIIPIPLLQKLAYTCFFWASTVIFSVLLFNPVVSLYTLRPKSAERMAARSVAEPGLFDRLLGRIARLSGTRRSCWGVIVVVCVLLGITSYLSTWVVIGDARPGTPLLWENSRYNVDEARVNEDFPGVMNPLLIVVQGAQEDAIKHPEVLDAMSDFQWYLNGFPEIVGTVAYPDLIKNIHMKFYEDVPKWSVIPTSSEKVGVIGYLMEGGGSEPGDYDKYIDYKYKSSNIAVYCRDRVASTINTVRERCTSFIGELSRRPELQELGVQFKLGAGLIALKASINDEIAKSNLMLLILALFSTAFFCAVFFRSAVAGVLLTAPLFVGNYLVLGYIAVMGIGLNVNTLPVTSIAIGIGVDYGIYCLERIREEYRKLQDVGKAVEVAIRTTGKAIAFTALTIIMSVFVWMFSSIRFQAEMGILLGIVTIFHLCGALVVLPALVVLVRPRFLLGIKKELAPDYAPRVPASIEFASSE